MSEKTNKSFYQRRLEELVEDYNNKMNDWEGARSALLTYIGAIDELEIDMEYIKDALSDHFVREERRDY